MTSTMMRNRKIGMKMMTILAMMAMAKKMMKNLLTIVRTKIMKINLPMIVNVHEEQRDVSNKIENFYIIINESENNEKC